jgi:flagellar hook assembly protein FlgD
MTPAEQVIRVTWDGKDEFGKHVGSGVYFYRLKAGHKDYVRKMLLIK